KPGDSRDDGGAANDMDLDAADCEQRGDPALLIAMRELLALAEEVPLADYHFAAVQWLRVEGLRSLEGMDCFPNLSQLEIVDGPPVDLVPLAESNIHELRLARLTGVVELQPLEASALT